jgi:hypothetical protein
VKKHNLHIIFGHTEKSLAASGLIDSNVDRIVFFRDKLEYGPLCDIDENIEERKEWLTMAFGGTMFYDFIFSNLEKDLVEIQSMVNDPSPIEKVFLWTGNDAFEKISTARVLSHLSKLDLDFYSVDYSEIELTNLLGEKYSPKTISVIDLSDYPLLFKRFKPVKEEEVEFYVNLWDRLKKENSKLRVLEYPNSVLAKDVSYFDEILLSNCTVEFQKCSRVIGMSLMAIDFRTDDHFLNWRLKCLAKKQQIVISGELIEIRDYQVKKLT